MTEDEAKTKWCPATRFISATESHHAFDNRGDVFDPMRSPGLCIASSCMAWRWRNSPHQYYTATLSDGSIRKYGTEPEIGIKVEPDYSRTVISVSSSPPSGGDGFCGLAGPIR